MTKFLLVFLLFSLPSISYGNNFTETYSRNIKFEYITYNVWSLDYDLQVNISDSAESLSTISRDYWAISGINWVFFCPADYSECWGNNYTINERFKQGVDLSFYSDTGERAVFWWDENTIPFLHQTGKINSELRGHIFEWLWNFPVLYANGKSMLEHYHDVWLYDKKMAAKIPRHFICSNKENTKIFFWKTSSSSLDDLAPALYEIWCWNGLNLDAWASSHFNYNGRELKVWSRKVLDWFFIIPKHFDAKEINTRVDTAMIKISSTFRRYQKNKSLSRLTAVREYIKENRTKIYEQYSQDIYDVNGNLNWYSLEVTNQKALQRIYLLNILDIKLKNLYKEISAVKN